VYLEHSLFGIADTHVISNGPCHSVAEEEEEEEGRRRRRGGGERVSKET
jgi:hypothetical protein